MFRIGVKASLLLTLFCPAIAAAQAELGWLVQDLPPHFSYAHGRKPQTVDDLGRGEIDGFMRLLVQRMPQYQHKLVEASMARFEALVRQQGETLCSVLHIRTPERRAWLHFTHLHPAMFSRQIHLIVRSESRERFAALGSPVQLAALQQREDLEGLLQGSRSFGPGIDRALQAQPKRPARSNLAGSGINLLAMLRAKRMDYTLEYPSVVDIYLKSVGAAPDEFIKLPLLEGRSTAVATAACSRTPAGRRAIEAIDQAVRQLARDPKREAWIREWRGEHMDPQDHAELIRYMDERARGGPLIDP